MNAVLKVSAIQAIRDSFNILSSETDLSPANPLITETLTKLVRTLTQCQSPELVNFLMNAPELAMEREKLPVLCGLAECEMEKYWAVKLAEQPACNLAEFWYFPEYTALCAAELDLIKGQNFDRISFLGSGALPLTGFILARHCPDTKIVCVDYDTEASNMAAKLARKIGLGSQVEMLTMSATEYVPAKNELVICASLLQGSKTVYENLARSGNNMIVRDCEGPYQYLYKSAELPSNTLFVERAKTAIDSKRINTSRYYERAHHYA